MDKIKIVFLGGLDEFYKSCIAIEINNDIFVVECGLKYPDVTKPGIDYVIPRYDYLMENKDRVKGYFLTHGHDSVIGALPYIFKKVPAPIYCTNITKLFLLMFCEHNSIDVNDFDIRIVNNDDDIQIGNQLIQLFQTCSNFANSYGISFNTNQGNIVFITNCVIDNNNYYGFSLNFARLASIVAKNKTLVLIQDSIYASNPGYTNPRHRIMPLVRKSICDSQSGRVIVALESPDLFNLMAVIYNAHWNKKKIICYDKSTLEIVNALFEAKCLTVPKDIIVPMEEVNRMRANELIIILTGFSSRLFFKIALLANNNHDEQIFHLNETDTFIIASHADSSAEIAKTDAIDQLYKTNVKIQVFDKPEFLIMHSSQEDIRTIISMLKPRYYVPYNGTFVKLLDNAKLALTMNVGLNHNSVFVLDNGDALEIDNFVAKVLPKHVLNGNLYVDGKGVGDVASEVLEERQRFSDDGIIILAATVSKSKREIVLGPDIQSRGLLFVKESDSLMKEIEKIFLSNIKLELAKENYSRTYLENNIKEQVFKSIRRHILKSPTIIPIIIEIE